MDFFLIGMRHFFFVFLQVDSQIVAPNILIHTAAVEVLYSIYYLQGFATISLRFSASPRSGSLDNSQWKGTMVNDGEIVFHGHCVAASKGKAWGVLIATFRFVGCTQQWKHGDIVVSNLLLYNRKVIVL